MRSDRLQRILALADLWGSLYLFHPWIGPRVCLRDWEQVFIKALPQVEQASDPAAALTILQTQVVQPLAGSLASVRTLFMDSPVRRVHEGWNEDGYPYVYGQTLEQGQDAPGSLFWQAGQPLALDRSETTHLSRAERILGLCKLWTVLRYFAPQLTPSEIDLDTMLADWLPGVEAAQNLREYYRLLEAIAVQLKDRHAQVIYPEGWRPERPEHENRVSRSPLTHTLLGSAWLGGVQYLRALTENLVYMLPFAMPDTTCLKKTFALIQNTNGLILELRGYPQTHFQHELVRCLCAAPVLSPRYEIPVISAPDVRQRTWKVIQTTVHPDGRAVYTQPVVALIDETTQSSAEDFCMYLKIAGRVTFVGQHTAGCVGNATYVNLPGGGRFTFTGMRVAWRDGGSVWGLGIQPDVPVETAAERRLAGRDEILEKGLETLQALVAQ